MMELSSLLTHVVRTRGSTAKESCDGAIADFVAEGGNAQDIISIETVDMREVA